MATFVTYSLLILDVLVIALAIQLVVSVPVWLVRRRRVRPIAVRGRGAAVSASDGVRVRAGVPASSGGVPTSGGFGGGARKRRCDDCRSGWVGVPGKDASVVVLRLRRAARRRARRGGRSVPEWAERRGWGRCPSCFSRNVRDSRKQTTVGAG